MPTRTPHFPVQSMPRAIQPVYAIPKDPVVYVTHLLPSGDAMRLEVYVEQKTGKDVIQCDLCGRYVKLGTQGSTLQLTKHRDKSECQKTQQRKQRIKAVNSDTVRQNNMGFGIQYPRSLQSQMTPQLNRDLSPGTPITPTTDFSENTSANITPRASHDNLASASRSVEINNIVSEGLGHLNLEQLGLDDITYEDIDSSSQHSSSDDETFVFPGAQRPLTECIGQRVEWTPGSVWETYAYHQHDTDSIGWSPIGFEEDRWIILRSKDCRLSLSTPEEITRQNCQACHSLLYSEALRRFIKRASEDEVPHTPLIYRNFRQLRSTVIQLQKKENAMKLEIMNYKRKIGHLRKRITDYQRVIMLLSQNKIAGVSRILNVCLRNKASIAALGVKLEMAINGAYSPQSGWTEREFDIAFLIKAIGGPRLLYALQNAEAYPSLSTLRKQKPIPELLNSAGTPSESEMIANITAILGKTGRKPPINPLRGQTAQIDGIAINPAVRFDFTRKILIGLCREHSASIKKTVSNLQDIENVATALFTDKSCHHGKEATILGIAPVTDKENYNVVPLIVSASCKSEKAEALSQWVGTFLKVYKQHKDGTQRHGPITTLATDGESSFRKLRFILCLSRDLERTSEMGKILYSLPGLNCRTGEDGIIGTCDPKHIVKRFATMIRSPSGIQVADTHLTSYDALQKLCQLMAKKEADVLLNPADKQNVPKAVTLVQSISKQNDSKDPEKPEHELINPSTYKRIEDVEFVGDVLGYFLSPFVDVEMGLSQQIRSLSTYSHLVTALYQKHRLGFLTSALLADSQAIVKNILFTCTRLQLLDPSIDYYILFEGTDRLENVFSHARTQDHAHNFDVLQLSQKLSIGAEIDAIFLRNPDLYRGHLRRNLIRAQGIDHINPESWIGNVCVGNVDIRGEYLAGREDANKLLVNKFGPGAYVNFDDLFRDGEVDHLRPGGKTYVGFTSSGSDDFIEDPEDDDIGYAVGRLINTPTNDPLEAEDARDSIDMVAFNGADVEPEDLNPLPEASPRSKENYITVDGKKTYIPTLLNSLLSLDEEQRKFVNTRPLRAKGVTLAQSLRGRSHPLNSSGDNLDIADNKLKSGDLGATLVRISGDYCLAVVECLNFQQGSSKALSEIGADDLDKEGQKRVSIAVQIVCLTSTGPSEESESGEATWAWSREYVRLQDSTGLDGKSVGTKRNFVTRIPGKQFYTLTPTICYNDAEVPVWNLLQSELHSVFLAAWNDLDPNSDAIVENVKTIPEILFSKSNPTHTDLPYTSNGKPCFYHPKASLPLILRAEKLSGKSNIMCSLCSNICQLRDMRKHVGAHILKKLRGQLDIDMQMGPDPCGWCGRSDQGCKSVVTKTPTSSTVSSNCRYHYAGMRYFQAKVFSETSPCTNVPLECPLCKKSFWKYNFLVHMAEFHLTDDGDMPHLPLELIVTTHISQREEERMGIESGSTKEWRDDNNIPGSDDIQGMIEESERERYERERRKRGMSDVSASSTSSNSRQPSPTKIQRRLYS